MTSSLNSNRTALAATLILTNLIGLPVAIGCINVVTQDTTLRKTLQAEQLAAFAAPN